MPSYEHRGKNSYRLTVETQAGINQERGRERKTVKLPEGLTPKKQKNGLRQNGISLRLRLSLGPISHQKKWFYLLLLWSGKTNIQKGGLLQRQKVCTITC